MKAVWLGCAALFMALPTFAQSVDELKRQLAAKEAEVQQLRQRIDVLEREVTPHRIRQTSSSQPTPVDEREDSNRALERSLVRENGLLLPKGKFELEPNFVYSHSTANVGSFRRDSYGPALVFRLGLLRRSQLDVSLPYVVERRRNNGVTTDASGFGDVAVGLSHQMLVERPGVPGLIGSLSYVASTGRNTIFNNASTVAPVALGSGFDSAQVSLTAIKRIDPLVFFGSYSFLHPFAETKNGIRVEPGDSHGLRIGTALASGPDTSLRAAFNLNFFNKTKIAGIAIPASDDPSAMLELGGSVVLSEATALDMLIGAGLTDNAPKYRVMIALPVRF